MLLGGAVSSGRSLWMVVAGTAETCAAQVGCCSLAVPSPGADWNASWPAMLAPSQCCNGFSFSQEHEAEPSAYKVRESSGWLSGMPVKALNCQNLSPALHSSF